MAKAKASADQARLAQPSGAAAIAAEDLADTLDELRAQLRRIRFVAESTEAHLEQYRGCEINRDDMLAAFSMVRQLAGVAIEGVSTIEKEVSHG